MSFAELIRTGVGLANQLTDSLQVSATVERWVSQDARGKATYSAALTVEGIYTKKAEILEREGQFIHTVGSLLILDKVDSQGGTGREEPFDTKDIFRLPGNVTGYPVLIEGPGDPAGGTYVTKVWFGKKTT